MWQVSQAYHKPITSRRGRRRAARAFRTAQASPPVAPRIGSRGWEKASQPDHGTTRPDAVAGGATSRRGGPKEPATLCLSGRLGHQARLYHRAAGRTSLLTSCTNIRDAKQADADDDVDDDLVRVRVRVRVKVGVWG
eukprot:scaffold110318_cov30-Phaeocystis_antarctica.AAC.1